jgi:5'-nucleotidase
LRILLVNDDGILADGINAAYVALSKEHEVLALAPDRERSASSHSITARAPVKITPIELPSGGKGYSCSGTPADCARLGIEIFGSPRFDMVVSGINNDTNLGFDTNYSGTVGGALEGTGAKIPSIAFSIQKTDFIDWVGAGKVVLEIVTKYADWDIPPNVALNVNMPFHFKPGDYSWAPIQAVCAKETFDVTRYPDGSMDCTRSRESVPQLISPFSDVELFQKGRITISPLVPVSTHWDVLYRLRS